MTEHTSYSPTSKEAVDQTQKSDDVNDEEGDWEGVVNVPDSLFGLLPRRCFNAATSQQVLCCGWIAKPPTLSPTEKVLRMSMILQGN